MKVKTVVRKCLVLLFLGMTFALSAQEVSKAPQGSPIYDWMLHNIVFIVAGIVIIGVLKVLFSVLNLFMTDYSKLVSKEGKVQGPVEKPQALFPSLTSIYKKAWDLVPLEKESSIDLGHDYDGIKELDNKLPPWWLYLFYFTILWAVAYVYIGHFSDWGASQIEEYEANMEVAAALKSDYLSKLANAVDETNATLVTDEKGLAEGSQLFLSLCAACHGQQGQGGVGPNFADKYWIHGGDVKDLFKTIKYGVPEKGMISWQSQLSPSSMLNVSSYILTLEGTDPPNQKDPEGELYDREEVEE